MAKILVVDDNDLVRASTRSILESAGHQVDETGDSSSVLAYVERTPPDLVLTDLVMPNRPGVDLIGELRRAGYDGAIIAMSGGGGVGGPVDLLSKAREHGADDCVAKPFHRADLFAKVTALLNRQSRS